MAYDEKLAARITCAPDRPPGCHLATDVRGLTFMVGGHMCCGVQGDTLILRLGPEGAADALATRRARLIPLVFLSNVFVEPEALPGWLKAFVDVSPISHIVTAARASMDGTVPGLELTVSLGTPALLTAVFAPLTTYLYGRK